MTGRSNVGLEVSGQRFLIRRMAHALVRGDVRMLDDPLRSQSLSLTAGCVLAVIAIGACAVLAVFQPRGSLGESPIMMVRDSGAMYVRIGDTVHPVHNLASARLVTGTAAAPELIGQSAVNDAPRGAMLGIPGAPDAIGNPLTAKESGWTVCEDATSTTTLMAGTPAGPPAAYQSALVTARDGSDPSTYLLYDGRRAKVDLRIPAVVRALKLDGVAPRPVSHALLDALPEAPEIAAPRIPHAGAAGPSVLHGFPVGTVIRVPRAQSSELFVVLADGVQRIGAVTADLIRFTQSHGRREIAAVAPGAVGAVPVVDHLPVRGHPERGGATDAPVVCAQWGWSADAGRVWSAVVAANALPPGEPRTLAQADAAGPQIDSVVFPDGRSAYVRACGVSGDGALTGPLYLVSDAGVAFGVHDEDAGKRLGLGAPVPAPWPVLARLPRGPELSVAAASVARDTVSTP
ncbi:type VII secretion protein EccB [Mycobacterium sp. B14F4]|uniref:type VII secretion protein EccB n=1 Tax=Mycobacterium sp. B14F4 TaxID=3153565 RepID=UPI00325D2F4B